MLYADFLYMLLKLIIEDWAWGIFFMRTSFSFQDIPPTIKDQQQRLKHRS